MMRECATTDAVFNLNIFVLSLHKLSGVTVGLTAAWSSA